MAILQECPICNRKQSRKNKECGECKKSLITKKGKPISGIRYWITYRLNGSQKWESVGFKLKDAKDLEGMRKGQKREKKLFKSLPGAEWTFQKLTKWYMKLDSVKSLKTAVRVQYALNNFNKVFGDTKITKVTLEGLKRYQAKRKAEGRQPATIDMEIKLAKAAVTSAYDNDQIDIHAMKPFRKLKKKLTKGTNARSRILSHEEYTALLSNALPHLKNILILGMNTGMRAGEIRQLEFKHINRKTELITLPARITKEKKQKVIPINKNVIQMLKTIIRRIDNDFVITYNGERIKQHGGFKKSFVSACVASGIKYGQKVEGGTTFHDIRRTVKTNMVEAGVNKIHRDVILGHALGGMDAHYIKPSPDSLTKAMDTYTNWMDNEWGCKTTNVNQTVI